jgi:predicted transposase YdaD
VKAAMKTDKQIDTLLGADPEFLRVLTDGIVVRGAYLFEALEVKGLERRTDGVLIPRAADEDIWVIEFQAQPDPAIYPRLLLEMALVGERHPGRVVRGFILFAQASLDPRTEPWHGLMARDPAPPLRRAYLPDLLQRLALAQPDHPLLAVFLPYLEDDLVRLREQAPPVYRRLQETALPESTRRHCVDVFQSWLMARFKSLSLGEILKMLGELTPLEETRAYRELVAKGRQEGREREARLVLRQLQRRLGPVSPAQQARMAALPIDTLEDLGEALLDFADTADLAAWLATH